MSTSPKTSKRIESVAVGLDRVWSAWHKKNRSEEQPPKLAITAERYGQIANVSRANAHAILTRKSDLGELKSGFFRVKDKWGGLRVTRHWWK